MSTTERDILQSDIILQDAMVAANEAFLRALRGKPVERYRPRPIYTPMNSPAEQNPNAARRQTELIAIANAERIKAKIERLRKVGRDPCTYCGVRGELGCKHRRAA